MLEEKQIEIGGRQFIISKFPAVAGREIITQYVASGMPKLGDYKRNEELMLKLMSYVAVMIEPGPRQQRLSTAALIDNHVGGWENLAKIELEMIGYNTSFFQNGSLSTFLNGWLEKLPAWISKILMDFSARSSQAASPPSENLEKITP